MSKLPPPKLPPPRLPKPGQPPFTGQLPPPLPVPPVQLPLPLPVPPVQLPPPLPVPPVQLPPPLPVPPVQLPPPLPVPPVQLPPPLPVPVPLSSQPQQPVRGPQAPYYQYQQHFHQASQRQQYNYHHHHHHQYMPHNSLAPQQHPGQPAPGGSYQSQGPRSTIYTPVPHERNQDQQQPSGAPPRGNPKLDPKDRFRQLNPEQATNVVYLSTAPRAPAVNIRKAYLSFGRFGKVMDIKEEVKNERNVMFIFYRTPEEATRAIQNTEDSDLGVERTALRYGKKRRDYTQEELDMPYDPVKDNHDGSKQISLKAAGQGHDTSNPTGDYPRRNANSAHTTERRETIQSRKNGPEPSNKLYIGRINPSTTKEDVLNAYTEYRPQRITFNRERTCCFLHYGTIEEATQCLERYRGAPLKGADVEMNYGTSEKGYDESKEGKTDVSEMLQDANRYDPREENPGRSICVWKLPGDIKVEEIEVAMRDIEGYQRCELFPGTGNDTKDKEDAKKDHDIMVELQRRAPMEGESYAVIYFDKRVQAMKARLEHEQFMCLGDSVRVAFYCRPEHSQDFPLRSTVDTAKEILKNLRLSPANFTVDFQTLRRTIAGTSYCPSAMRALLPPARTKALILGVDSIATGPSADTVIALRELVLATMPQQAAHAAAVVAKRIDENYHGDAPRDRAVRLAACHAVLGAFVTGAAALSTCVNITPNDHNDEEGDAGREHGTVDGEGNDSSIGSSSSATEAITMLILLLYIAAQHQSATGREQLRQLTELLKACFLDEDGLGYKNDIVWNQQLEELIDQLRSTIEESSKADRNDDISGPKDAIGKKRGRGDEID